MPPPWNLGEKSYNELKYVHRDLVLTVKEALVISPIDFAVHDGIRTVEEQRVLVDNGASHTMNSRHLPSPVDDLGRAVDLVPYLNGKLRWEWPLIYPMIEAVHAAAVEMDTLDSLLWGAVWDRNFNDLNVNDLEGEVQAYADRRRAQGKSAFLDGPHIQLRWDTHP